jgi:hypothetical protein
MELPDPRPTVEAPDDDPYLWLQEIEGDRAWAWVEAQNGATLERLADAQFAADRDVLKAISTSAVRRKAAGARRIAILAPILTAIERCFGGRLEPRRGGVLVFLSRSDREKLEKHGETICPYQNEHPLHSGNGRSSYRSYYRRY